MTVSIILARMLHAVDHVLGDGILSLKGVLNIIVHK